MIPATRRTHLVLAALLAALAPNAALGNQYWVAYEGNDYPENEGWQRIWYYTPAERSLEDGCLVLDMRDDPFMVEFYDWPTGGHVDPDPGELLVMQWRLRVDEVDGYSGPGILIGADNGSVAAFKFHENKIRDTFYAGVEAYFEPGLFHEFELRSYDMMEYQLYIDGNLALQHSFKPETTHVSRMSWGHGVTGVTSLTRWDYVRFGVVPEPSAGIALLALVVWRARRRARINKSGLENQHCTLTRESNND